MPAPMGPVNGKQGAHKGRPYTGFFQTPYASPG